MSAAYQQPSLQNYVKDDEGNTVIPSTRRPDGSWRKPIKVREGFIPQDEVPIYQSRGQIMQQQQKSQKGAKPVGVPQQQSPATAAIGGGASGPPNANKQKKLQNPSGTGQKKQPQNIDEASRATAQLPSVAVTSGAAETGSSGAAAGAGGGRGAAGARQAGLEGVNAAAGGDESGWQVVGPKKGPTPQKGQTGGGKPNGALKVKATTDQVPQKVSKETKKAGGGDAGLQSTALQGGDGNNKTQAQIKQQGKGKQQPAAAPGAASGKPAKSNTEKTQQKQSAATAAGGTSSTTQQQTSGAVGAGQSAPGTTPAAVALKQPPKAGALPKAATNTKPSAGASAGSASGAASAAAAANPATRLRNLKKMLRAIKDLEDQVKTNNLKLNADQEEKLKKKKQLQNEIKQLEQKVGA